MEALSVTDHRARNLEFALAQTRPEKLGHHLVTRPQQAGSAGDTGPVNDIADIRRTLTGTTPTAARSRTGGRR